MTITDIPKPDGPDDNIGELAGPVYLVGAIWHCLHRRLSEGFAQAKVTRRLQWGDALMIFALLSRRAFLRIPHDSLRPGLWETLLLSYAL
ncbi:hypothetical protein FOXG_22746 [Fusarium oxysporum f. sp. lycopersici 4287]|uniref:Uncharacterized protein n=1 Tax=Fusarium oxysporum f. sp. lycopersici (strain 4287 / CBS 123668 / FGSC 9935 / NRRL 34936) TaxID=426428 RepID=A0A0J9WB40_FUSO4|nr:hypothetical protein FOXG_22746 [Fusarium oxysporum f. sp. lycopersici 4287]KNB20083.1 hypothetical protein FOXG_22746 [Fusarium oxysporum f. sp. lycopersici 4287]